MSTSLQEVRLIYRQSQPWDTLTRLKRWTKFKVNESDKTWNRYFGQTGTVSSHQEWFTTVVQRFIAANETTVSAKQKELLVISAAIHDIGEATIGDVPAPLKTLADFQDEAVAAFELIQTLDCSSEIKQFLAIAYFEVVVNERSYLHKIFCFLEEYEYVLTALTVRQRHAEAQRNNLNQMEKADQLVYDALHRHVPKLLAMQKNIKGGSEFLQLLDTRLVEACRYVYSVPTTELKFGTNLLQIWQDWVNTNQA